MSVDTVGKPSVGQTEGTLAADLLPNAWNAAQASSAAQIAVGNTSEPVTRQHGETSLRDQTDDATLTALTALLSTESGQERPTSRVAGMKKWQGRVLSVDDELFEAELTPLDHEGPVVVADFETAHLDIQDDADCVRPGDVFYMTVRTVYSERAKTRTTTSALRLRRMGRWSQQELDRLRKKARQRMLEFEKHVD